jgi:hypothetical protein
VSANLAAELPPLIEYARSRKLRFPPDALRAVDLDGNQINTTHDALETSIDQFKTVITPGGHDGPLNCSF